MAIIHRKIIFLIEDLTRTRYTKYKILIILLYFSLHTKNQIQKSRDFYSFFLISLLAIENLQITSSSNKLIN
jgi:hypothetical protein